MPQPESPELDPPNHPPPLRPVAQVSLGGADSDPSRRQSRGKAPRQPFFSSWQVVAAFALAAVTFLSSSFLAWGIADPMGPAGEASPLAWVHDQRAAHYLARAQPTSAQLAAAEAESWAALNQAPVDDVAWLNLASIDRLRHGRLTDKGLLYIQRSYDVAPYGPDTSLWRVRFCLENWPDLTPELRKQMLDELKVQWPTRKRYYREMAPAIRNDAGRLAALLVTAQLKADDQARKLRSADNPQG